MNKDDLKVFIAIVDELTIFFNGSSDKVAMWMTTENPLLGGETPIEFIRLGRGRYLLNYVKKSADDELIYGQQESYERQLVDIGFQKAIDALKKQFASTTFGESWPVDYLINNKDEILK
jgi:hypothetical protein